MKKWFAFLLLLDFTAFPQPVFAHAFGKLYNLPVPFWLYLYGGAGAVIISFVVIGFFVNQNKKDSKYPTVDISGLIFFRLLTSSKSKNIGKVLGFLFFLLTIITGIFGADDSYSNINMTLFWIIFVLGLTYFTAIFGNIYSVISPFRTIIEAVEKLLDEELSGILKYPEKAAFWPAFIFYFLFIWLELLGQTSPFRLSAILIIYLIVTVIGVDVFGKKDWLSKAEFFNVFFDLISKVSPFEINGKSIRIRPPFVQITFEKPLKKTGLLFFILFMLSSTSFDGFRETVEWSNLYKSINLAAPILGSSASVIVQTISLATSLFVFLSLYLALLTFSKIITKTKDSILNLAYRFCYTLIPIAIAYNIAHYYTLLITQGQEIIRLASDPFGFGWNLFGTSSFVSNPGVLAANFVWHSQVAVILIGHIAAVYLAHLIALSVFPTHKKALISQLPMLALMIIYTTIGLWILSQPLSVGT